MERPSHCICKSKTPMQYSIRLQLRAQKSCSHLMMPFGEYRYGTLQDPFGYRWSIARRLEDISPAEVQHRARDFVAKTENNKKAICAVSRQISPFFRAIAEG